MCYPLVLPPGIRPGVLERIDGVGVPAVLRMARLQPPMLTEVAAADRMDVGLAFRSREVDAIRSSVSGYQVAHSL